MANISNRLLLTLGLIGLHLLANAADEVPKATTGIGKDETFLYVLIVTILVVILFVVGALASMVLSNVRDMRREVLAQRGIILEEKAMDDIIAGFFSKFWKQANDLQPIELEEEIALDHNYDGIRELDNNLPPWWKALFYGSIVWGVGYLFYYHVTGNGMLSAELYLAEMKQAELEHEEYLKTAAESVNESTVTVLSDAGAIAKGKSIYMANCVACHGALGEGGVGPNFADNYWIHGGSIKDIFSTIKYGVPAKGMISWSTQLRPLEMQQVASFILTLQGTNPPNQKEAQGTIWIEDGGELAPIDTLAAATDTLAAPVDTIVAE